MRLNLMLEKTLNYVDKHALLFILLVFVFRLFFLFSNHLVLIGDESYYWDWSRQPDWCYYSKPPMVAWLIGLFTHVLGDYPAILRLPTVFLGSGFLIYFHALAKACYGQRAASFALLLILATPDNVIANLLMTIDPPLYCFWMISIYYLYQALFNPVSKLSHWFIAGLFGALALLSKQAALLLPLILLIFILTNKQRYHYLKKPYCLFLLPMLLASLPLLYWNAQHDWIMLGHSKSHFSHQGVSSLLESLDSAKKFIFYQLLLISPLIFIASLFISGLLLYRYRRITSTQQFLVLFGAMPLMFVLGLSFGQKVQGNWPMLFYFPVLILLAGYWQAGRWRKFLEYSLATGLMMVLITYLLPSLLQIFHLEDTKLNPVRRYRHWQTLANNIQTIRQTAIADLSHSFVVALGHRNLASELAFYLPDHPKVYRYQADGYIVSQYELWPNPDAFIGGNALIISDPDNPVPEAIKNAFSQFHYISTVANPKQANSPYDLYLGEHLLAWPSTGLALQPSYQD